MTLLLMLCGALMVVQASGPPAGGDKGGAGKPKKPDSSVRLRLGKEAFIPGRRILLGDLAVVETEDEGMRRYLEKLPLGPAPGAHARLMTESELRSFLISKGLDKDKLSFEGSSRIELIASRTRVSARELIHAAELTLRALLHDEGENDVEWVRPTEVRDVWVPVGREQREIVATVPTGKLTSTSAFFQVQIKVDGEVVSSVPMQLRLRRYRRVLITRKRIKRGEAFTADNVSTGRVDVAGSLVEPLQDPARLKGMVAALDLRPGTTLSAGYAVAPALIKKGDRVTVVAIFGKVRITTNGSALRDGTKGQTIPVSLNTNPHSPIFAKVHGTGIVLIEKPEPVTHTRRGSPRGPAGKKQPSKE
ncbi:MAG: flagellar basal body P-ring formation chaperone FlgA [Planctomycetota bacterium]